MLFFLKENSHGGGGYLLFRAGPSLAYPLTLGICTDLRLVEGLLGNDHFNLASHDIGTAGGYYQRLLTHMLFLS